MVIEDFVLKKIRMVIRMNNLDTIVKVLMCITLVVFIIYNVCEIVETHKYYKQCKKAHEKYLEELIDNLKTKEK